MATGVEKSFSIDSPLKKKLGKVLTFYPDVPQCGGSGHSYDRNGRKSNSLCDHYSNIEIRHTIDNMINV